MDALRFNVCACLGPQGADPYCPCGMRTRGLESSVKPLTKAEEDALFAQIEQAFAHLKDKR